MTPRALIFDVDGTLAETEELHREAFTAAFANAGLDWSWDRDLYRDLLRTTGGRERILVYAGRIGADVDAGALHKDKTRIYGERVDAGMLTLRPGVAALIEAGRRKGMALAIATTTSRPNVAALIQATLGREAIGWFASIRTGEDVKAKKPDPEVYRLVLSDLGLPARDCIAFEDTQNGLVAALEAGLRTIVTPSLYSDGDDFTGAALVVDSMEALRNRPEFRIG
ncbi:MAG TPA: HAD-IA family hydrolase [Rhodoblastus sp.]|nr:HAD-IA family hydrolase [Rhodoblastus sp.]